MGWHSLGIHTGQGPSNELRICCECRCDSTTPSLSKVELEAWGYQLPEVSSNLLNEFDVMVGFIELVEAITTLPGTNLRKAGRALKRAKQELEAFGKAQTTKYLEECESLAREKDARMLVEKEIVRIEESATWVYFIQDVQADAIKIGFSKNVSNRVAALQTSTTSPLKLLVCVPGGRKTEKELHEKFVQFHIRGEWFRSAPELLQYVETLRTLPELVLS
jgi:hypothetical protein